MKTKARIRRFPMFERYEADKERMVNNIFLCAVCRDLTFVELSAKSGVHANTISRLNRGITTYPRCDTLWKLARAAGMKLSVLEK